MFTTDTGVSTLVLKEVPYKQVAYVTVQSVQPGGLREHLKECAAFCRMCGAERILATGPALEGWPVSFSVWCMDGPVQDRKPPATLDPVTEATVGRWREIYNEKMRPVDNAATMTARDEKRILGSGGAYFVSDGGTLLGIGWLEGSKVLAVASVVKGAGERVLRTLLTTALTDWVSLEVACTNERAIALYERLGFTALGEISIWYDIT